MLIPPGTVYYIKTRADLGQAVVDELSTQHWGFKSIVYSIALLDVVNVRAGTQQMLLYSVQSMELAGRR